MSMQHETLSLEAFTASLNLESSLTPKELEALVFELFVSIRTNTECGLWVDVEDFGSFHPLWYEIKKHKETIEDKRIREEIQARKEEERLHEEKLKQKALEQEQERQRIHEEKLKASQEKLLQKKALIQQELKEQEKIQAEELKQEQRKQKALQEEEKEKREEEARAQEAKQKQEALEKEHIKAEKLEKERLATEQLHKEKVAQERIRLELLEKENAAERLRQQERERKEKERLEKEALEKEKSEQKSQQLKEAQREKEENEQKELEKEKQRIQALNELERLRKKAQEKQEEPLKKRKDYTFFYIAAALFLGVLFLWFLLAKVDEAIEDKNSVAKEYKSFEILDDKEGLTLEHFYHHEILKGDTLYSLSKALYGDSKYWPIIYAKNCKNVRDMDKIYPGDFLEIPRIEKGSSADEALTEVYVIAYKAYKRLGKDNKAHWLLYWGIRNINSDLIEIFNHEIEQEDREKVQGYLNRF